MWLHFFIASKSTPFRRLFEGSAAQVDPQNDEA